MASGRHDYWYGMLPGKAALSVNQTEWFVYGSAGIPSGDNAALIDYTVTDNYKLNIVGGIITCGTPGINTILFGINGVIVWNIWFDQSLALPFNVGASHVLNGGQEIQVRCINLDDVVGSFRCTLFGFEEYVIGL